MKQKKYDKELKVVIIGAGSSVFGPPNLYDLINNVPASRLNLCLVDIDRQSVDLAKKVGQKLAEQLSENVVVNGYQDRKKALPEADFVIITAEEDRISTWKRDWEILKDKFELAQPLAENRGPGGLSHTLRTVPLALNICKDVENLAPEAFVLVLTNPEDRIAYAVREYTNLEVAGYCDGLWDFKIHYLSELLNISPQNIHVHAAGINHAVWVKELYNKKKNENIYSHFIEKAKQEDWQPLGQHLYELYGLWPHENDEHYGEYIGYACEFIDCKGYDFQSYLKREKKWEEKQTKFIEDNYLEKDFISDVKDFTWEIYGDSPPSDILKGFYFEPQYLPNANVANENSIPDLPDDMIVEIPAVATPAGIINTKFDGFSDALTGFLQREGAIQKLSAQAAAEGSYDKALKALILDDNINSPSRAQNILDCFLEAHQKYLPQY